MGDAFTVNAVKFAGLIFRDWQHKNIFSRVVEFVLSKCSLRIFLYCTNEHDSYTSAVSYKQLGITKTNQALHTFFNLLPICINTHVHTEYRKYFCGVLNSRLLNFA